MRQSTAARAYVRPAFAGLLFFTIPNHTLCALLTIPGTWRHNARSSAATPPLARTPDRRPADGQPGRRRDLTRGRPHTRRAPAAGCTAGGDGAPGQPRGEREGERQHARCETGQLEPGHGFG